MSKKKLAEADLTRIEEALKKMNNEKGDVGLSLLEEISFMKQTLKKMRKEIAESSLTAEYSSYKRSNPIIAGYNAMINNYSKLTRQLADLLPKEASDLKSLEDILKEDYDDFDDF